MVVVVVVVLVRGGKLSSMTSNHRKLGCDTSTQSHNHTHTTTITNIIKILREGLNSKRTFSFGHCPNEGGGVYPCPNFLALFQEVQFWSINSLLLQKCQCIELLTVF